MKYYTGRVDCTIPSIQHETLADAEAWIAEMEKIDPDGVFAGDYFIDVPEDCSCGGSCGCNGQLSIEDALKGETT